MGQQEDTALPGCWSSNNRPVTGRLLQEALFLSAFYLNRLSMNNLQVEDTLFTFETDLQWILYIVQHVQHLCCQHLNRSDYRNGPTNALFSPIEEILRPLLLGSTDSTKSVRATEQFKNGKKSKSSMIKFLQNQFSPLERRSVRETLEESMSRCSR